MNGKSKKILAERDIRECWFCLLARPAPNPIEAVFNIDVEKPRAYVAALDRLFESEAMQDQKVALWAATFDGSSPATHVVVAEFDSYEQYVSQGSQRTGSAAWSAFVLEANDIASTVSNGLVVQRLVDGDGWRGHGSLAAFIMTVKDPAAYTAAFSELIRSTDNPGSVRLMEMRAGGEGTTHVVLITAPGFVELNEYLDELLASAAYRDFAGKVSGNRTIRTVTMYRRIKTWGD